MIESLPDTETNNIQETRQYDEIDLGELAAIGYQDGLTNLPSDEIALKEELEKRGLDKTIQEYYISQYKTWYYIAQSNEDENIC